MKRSDFDNLQNLVLNQKPEKSQAIIWLQGDRLDRGKKVVELFFKKIAPRVVISGNNLLIGKNKRPGENDISLEKIKLWLIKKGIPEKAIIIDDQSLNTSEQAKNILKLCIKKKWHKIIIVSSPYHQTRAFLTFLNYKDSFNSNIQIINQPAIELSWDKKASGRELTRRQLIEEEIKKIKKYNSDVASIPSAFSYLKKFNIL